MPETTTRQILCLLAARHKDDVFVPECKMGPTWGITEQRLDAWAMAKSWAHPLTTGYEIKTNRADFVRDDKWRGYLPVCNAFYFVAPRGVIREEEVGVEAGLVEVASTGSRLLTKRKAPYRAGGLDEALAKYLLMSRVRVVNEWEATASARDERLKDWLATKKDLRSLGDMVGKGIRDQVAGAKRERDAALAKVEAYREFENNLTKAGINLKAVAGGHLGRQREIDRLRGRIPHELRFTVREVLRLLGNLDEDITQIESGAEENEAEEATNVAT